MTVSDVGQAIIDRLIEHGVGRVFGVPGGQTSPFYHGAATRKGDIEHVLTRDERSASFAADAYARVTGRVGACDATVGAGSVNLVPGLIEALNSSIPVVAIVADIPRGWEHRRRLGSASQGCEQYDYLRPCVKWFGRVLVPDSACDVVDHALRIATSNRPGPVVIEVPDDVMGSPSVVGPALGERLGQFPRNRIAADPAAIARAAKALAGAHRPALLVGGGAHISGAGAAVGALAEQLGAPVVTTISGKGIVAETHPLSVGPVGSFGTPVGNEVLAAADCVVVIGCKLGQTSTLGWAMPDEGATVIHIDIDDEEIGRNHGRSIAVQADARLGAESLRAALGGRTTAAEWNTAKLAADADAWWSSSPDQRADDPAVHPARVIAELSSLLGDGDVVVTDASLSSGWATSRWRTRAAGRRLLAPRGVAGLGWGLPGGIGAAFALRDGRSRGRAVCLAGDGAWGYSLGEVETAARFELPVVSIVLNNGVLGWNKHVISERYPDGWVSQDLNQVDYATAARALGAHAVRVADPAELPDALAAALAVEGRPSVVEVMSSPYASPVAASMSGGTASY